MTAHAAQQMAARDVTRVEVERVLKAGSVVMIETDPGGGERWRTSGRDADGGRIEVVVGPFPPAMAVVITVIRVN